MSKLKLTENLFLEVNELNKQIDFITTNGYKRLFKSIVTQFGIVKNTNNTNFKVVKTSNGVVTVNAGLAFDSNLDAIVMNNNTTLNVSNTNIKRWIILSRSVSNYETGTVSITSDGTLTGVGTEFTKILRGQPNFPTKLTFNSSNNTDDYEVVSVISNTSAILSGSFIAESNKQFSIVGTFTPGFIVNDNNKHIYEYDSYELTIVDSASKPSVTDNQFIIACVYYTNGVMYVTDERVYCTFNNTYTQLTSKSGLNPITSLISSKLINGTSYGSKSAEIELILEHAYQVNSFSMNVNSNYNIFTILSGTCNFYQDGVVTNNLFDGWILLNRNNMKYATVDYNIGNDLYISTVPDDLIVTSNDFIIVPNYSNIEYEITLNSNINSPSIPFHFISSIANRYTRVRIYAIYPSIAGNNEVTVGLKYRMIDNSGNQYPYKSLAIATFNNISNIDETLSDSKFTIDLSTIEPQAEERNYS